MDLNSDEVDEESDDIEDEDEDSTQDVLGFDSEGHSEEPEDKGKDPADTSEEGVEDASDDVPLVQKWQKMAQMIFLWCKSARSSDNIHQQMSP
ncbi:hypothetical protein LIER_39000 [Lithospermum erythrorhizon]|uniref:Uncharacterized protein n=1 Tax=Lithospermum erythrorhizon TaxID=34254 RepID=A0AAV3Q843_LITER